MVVSADDWHWFFSPTKDAYVQLAVMAIVGAVVFVVKVFSSWLMFWTCTIPPMARKDFERYVDRDGLEERIRAHVNQDDVTNYLVVVGPRGGGKSTAIKRVLARRARVVYVELDETTKTIYDALLSKTLWLSFFFSYRRSLAAYELYPGYKKPVFVVEISTPASDVTVKNEAQQLKELCTAHKGAHGILILSDANAAGKLNQDDDRQKFVWVGVFSENELERLFDNLGVLVTGGDAEAAALRRKIIDEIGPTPQAIVDTANEANEPAAKAATAARSSGATEAECVAAGRAAVREVFEQWCEQKQRDASIAVNHLVTQAQHKDGFRRLLPVLVESYPVGVSPENHLSAKEASTDIKDYHAISFNAEAKVYQFYSRAHYHAARRWLQKEAEAKAARWWSW